MSTILDQPAKPQPTTAQIRMVWLYTLGLTSFLFIMFGMVFFKMMLVIEPILAGVFGLVLLLVFLRIITLFRAPFVYAWGREENGCTLYYLKLNFGTQTLGEFKFNPSAEDWLERDRPMYFKQLVLPKKQAYLFLGPAIWVPFRNWLYAQTTTKK